MSTLDRWHIAIHHYDALDEPHDFCIAGPARTSASRLIQAQQLSICGRRGLFKMPNHEFTLLRPSRDLCQNMKTSSSIH
jgi:hypothetical protein